MSNYEYQKEWVKKNRDKVNAAQKRYYAKHREEVTAKAREKYKPTGNIRGKHITPLLGEKNGRWVGGWDKANRWWKEKPSYKYLHKWISLTLGKPDTCELCGTTNLHGHKVHWASKSRKYKLNSSDWIRLCVKCHYKYDKQNNRKDKLGRWT